MKHQKKYPMTPSFSKLILRVVFNQLFVLWPVHYALSIVLPDNYDIPFYMTLPYIAAYGLIDEFGFYHTHKLCHTGNIYLSREVMNSISSSISIQTYSQGASSSYSLSVAVMIILYFIQFSS